MNTQQALDFAQERLDKISYHLEMTNKLPCRSFYEKQQDMLIQAVAALREKLKHEKGCEYCDPKNVDYYYAGNVPNYCKHCGRKLNDRC